MYRKIVFPILFLLFAFPAITQTTDPAVESARLAELSKKLEGTYQLQIINSREAGEIPLQYMDTIVARRNAIDTTYFIYPNKPQMRLMILPESVISQANFKKPVRIIHVIK
ncbi:MAG TPA: hypothetical protein VFJ43_15890 [Bacteroidia bacterium]|nr:hypothetical protein [Bacteroidia bacterium]